VCADVWRQTIWATRRLGDVTVRIRVTKVSVRVRVGRVRG